MNLLKKSYLVFVIEVLLIIFIDFQSVSGLAVRIPYRVQNYFANNFYETQYAQIKTALGKLEHEPQWVTSWPDPSVKMGQVSGLALDNNGLLLVFHRATNIWDENTFTYRNVYKAIGEPAISRPTILVFNDTGELVDAWGQNLFYMPHGITVDSSGNVWVTDVALHQVFKFTPEQRQKPALVLGEKFVPGNDDEHFCKPSAVAVMTNGDFFVADGYCNTRIIKYSSDGTKILQWGKRTGDSPFSLNVPHALTLVEGAGAGAAESAVCVADREHGRVVCFHAGNGTYLAKYSSWLVGGRVFSVAYSPAHGGRLYVVNGPGVGVPVRGYVLDYESGTLLQTFAPDSEFRNPHDVVVSPDGSRVYVAELNPFTVQKFVSDGETRPNDTQVTLAPVKPTAVVELSVGGGGAAGWWGLAGGAAGAAGLAAAALALLRARNRGKGPHFTPLVT